MRLKMIWLLPLAAVLLSAPALAGPVSTGLDETEQQLTTEEITCEHQATCDGPSAVARAEVGGAEVSAAPPAERCLTDKTLETEAQDPDCQPAHGVDPGVVRLYVGVKQATGTNNAQPATYDPQANGASSASGDGMSLEMKAAMAAGVLSLGAGGAVALFGVRRFTTLLLGPLAARLQPSELLEDETRRALYETIKRDPGINLRALSDELDLAWGTLLHHLHKLENAHMVVSKRYGKYRRYFLNGSTYSQEEKARLAALSTPSTARVAEYILDHPGSTQSEIGDALDVTASTVLWHARRLKDVDLLETKRDGRYVRYYPRLTQDEASHLNNVASA
ncbi:MAG: winged helix-turn-helix transcriptional regulator [Candidatus Thermoplasmatota archaeon]|nr:winged helix-turn-helix transcriptional regulator [Candidatus Thermoplasmatota archaeon]